MDEIGRLGAFQKHFLSSLRGDAPEGPKRELNVWAPGALSPSEALDIYRNNYYQNLKMSLAHTYEACAQILTRSIFDKLAHGLIKENPYRNNRIASYGEDFPEFLEKTLEKTLGKTELQRFFPFLYQLACLERLIREVFLEEKGAKSMEISYPVHQIWSSLLHEDEDGDETIIPLKGKHTLFVFREDSEMIFFEVLGLKMPSERATFRYGKKKQRQQGGETSPQHP